MKEKQKKRFKKESLLSKINIFSLSVETNVSNRSAAVFHRKDKKKAQISRHFILTYTLIHIMFSVTQSAVAQSVRVNVVSKRSVKVR